MQVGLAAWQSWHSQMPCALAAAQGPACRWLCRQQLRAPLQTWRGWRSQLLGPAASLWRRLACWAAPHGRPACEQPWARWQGRARCERAAARRHCPGPAPRRPRCRCRCSLPPARRLLDALPLPAAPFSASQRPPGRSGSAARRRSPARRMRRGVFPAGESWCRHARWLVPQRGRRRRAAICRPHMSATQQATRRHSPTSPRQAARLRTTSNGEQGLVPSCQSSRQPGRACRATAARCCAAASPAACPAGQQWQELRALMRRAGMRSSRLDARGGFAWHEAILQSQMSPETLPTVLGSLTGKWV